MADGPTPIAIIVAGQHAKQGAAMIKLALSQPDKFHAPIDVRQWLHRDPRQPSEGKQWQVQNWMNADYLPCQLEGLRQPAFVECVRSVAEMMALDAADRKVWVVYCTAGQHRSDGVSKAVTTRVFNAEWGEERLYNCNIFSLSNADVATVESVAAEALRWAAEPWMTRHDDCPWAEDAKLASSVAFKALAEIDAIGEDIMSRTWDGDLSMDRRRPPPPIDVDAEPERDHRRPWKTPIASRGATGSGDAAPPAQKRRKVGASECRDEACPFCEGTGVKRPLPPVDTVEAWSIVLESLEVDENARLDWCALYSAVDSEKAKQEALSIVHKILKKDSGGHGVDNPSAFIVSTVKNAWKSLRGGW